MRFSKHFSFVDHIHGLLSERIEDIKSAISKGAKDEENKRKMPYTGKYIYIHLLVGVL